MKKLVANKFVSIGSKNLPYSLQAAMKEAAIMIHEYKEHSNSSCIQNVEDNDLMIYNNIEDLYINNNIKSITSTFIQEHDYVKSRCKGFIDIHLSCPKLTKYAPKSPIGWKFILLTYAYSSMLNFHYVNELVNFPYKYAIDETDLKSTLASVMTRMCGKSDSKAIDIAIAQIVNDFTTIDKASDYIKSISHDVTEILQFFYKLTGETYLDYWMNKFSIYDDREVNYSDDDADHYKFKLPLFEYGSKRTQKWTSIVARNGQMCMYVPADVQAALGTIYHNKGWKETRKFLEISCGLTRYYDFDVIARNMQYVLSKTKETISNPEEIIYKYCCDIIVPLFEHMENDMKDVPDVPVVPPKETEIVKKFEEIEKSIESTGISGIYGYTQEEIDKVELPENWSWEDL